MSRLLLQAAALIVVAATLSTSCARAADVNAEPDNLDPPPASIPDPFVPLNPYSGKTTEQWLAVLKMKDDPAALKQALSSLVEMAPFAAGASAATRDLLAIAKESSSPETARLALLMLGKIGPDAREAEAALVAMLNNILEGPVKRSAACRALIQIAPSSARVRKAILTAAADRYNEVRYEAIDALIVLAMPAETATQPAVARGEKPKVPARNEAGVFPYPPALEALAKASLSARDASAADAALRTLGDAGVEPLLRALENGSPAARAIAAETLGGMRRAERRVLPALIQAAQKEPDRRVREAASYAAAALNPRDPAVLELLARCLGARNDPLAPFRSKFADEFLFEAGVDALPGLRKALRADSAVTRLAALKILERAVAPPPEDAGNRVRMRVTIRALPSQPIHASDCLNDIAARLEDRDEGVRGVALNALNRMGPVAAGAFAALERAAHFPETGNESKSVRTALADFRHLAAIAALNVSREPDSKVCLTPLDRLSCEQLLTILGSAAPDERTDAALALRLHGSDVRAPDALFKACEDPDPRLRRAAARALGALGPRAAAAVPELLRWLDSEPKSRVTAIEALADLGTVAAAAAPALAKSIAEDPWIEDADFEKAVLCAMRAHAVTVVPALIGYVRAGAPGVRVRSARALGLLGATAAEALPALIELAQSTDDTEARAAFEAMRLIGPEKDPDATPFLSNVIHSSLYATRRKWAVLALGLSRPALDVGVPQRADALAAALRDGDAGVCRAAYEALIDIGEPAVPILVEAVSRDRSARSFWPLLVLAALKADPALVVPRLYEFTLPGHDGMQRAEAVVHLGNYAALHPGVAPALVRVLRSREPVANRAAMRALKPLAAEARPLIERLLVDRDPAARKLAAEMLDSWGKD